MRNSEGHKPTMMEQAVQQAALFKAIGSTITMEVRRDDALVPMYNCIMTLLSKDSMICERKDKTDVYKYTFSSKSTEMGVAL